ncbi:MAG: hypothetical protein JXR44_07205 [Thiotrichales bacterium]|nr:hypothetical protein [Thiotrichales bacterium]
MKFLLKPLFLALSLTAFSLNVQAQPQMQLSAEQQQMLMQLQQVQAGFLQSQQELQAFQGEAIESSSDLQKMRDDLRNKMTQKMNVDGYNAEAEIAKLNEVIQAYEKTGAEPSTDVIADFQQRQQRLQQKQAQVIQDPEIQTLAQTFETAVMKVVKQKHPESTELLKRIDEQGENLQQLRKQVQASMAAGASAP